MSLLDDSRRIARETLAEGRADLDGPRAEDYPYWYERVTVTLTILLDALDEQDAQAGTADAPPSGSETTPGGAS